MEHFTAGLLLGTLIYVPAIFYLFYVNKRLIERMESIMNWVTFREDLKKILALGFANLLTQGVQQGHLTKDDVVQEAKQDAIKLVFPEIAHVIEAAGQPQTPQV